MHMTVELTTYQYMKFFCWKFNRFMKETARQVVKEFWRKVTLPPCHLSQKRLYTFDLNPIYGMVPWTHISQSPNGISIGSVILEELARVLNRQTDRQCICRNRLHLCNACDAATKRSQYVWIVVWPGLSNTVVIRAFIVVLFAVNNTFYGVGRQLKFYFWLVITLTFRDFFVIWRFSVYTMLWNAVGTVGKLSDFS